MHTNSYTLYAVSGVSVACNQAASPPWKGRNREQNRGGEGPGVAL